MLFFSLIVALGVGGAVRAEELTTPGKLAIMQGATSTEVVQIIVLGSINDQNYRFVLRHGKEKKSPTVLNTVQRNGSTHRLYRLRFEGLKAGTTYSLEVRSGKRLLDRRTLRTLVIDKKQLQFIVASCMDDSIEQGDIWRQVAQLDPDVIFLIGDNSYTTHHIKSDYPTPDDLWRRHAETRNYIDLFRNEKLYPIIAVWDDHDYGVNNGGQDYRYKNESLAIFKNFFMGSATSNFQLAGLGLASRAKFYGLEFFLLDNRTFRTTANELPQFHFGDLQSRWLTANLSDKGYAFVISGDQFFGGYHQFESFQGNHRQRFPQFLKQLKDTARKVVFLSGDRHLSEAMKIPPSFLGYSTYEFTSSPVHGKLYPSMWDERPNPLQIAGRAGVHNFLAVTVRQQTGILKMEVTSRGKKGKVYWRGTHSVR